ncbi:hypothetical protein [Thermodesulfatator atlanticus]|uniref:hypothetical protein n=1 Tax=Thermodesulfatator atlanticus TaxID=501497 RepID=UPI0003B6E04A|nr:hypothetical protein [Thermodesulfatator atlanticus]
MERSGKLLGLWVLAAVLLLYGSVWAANQAPPNAPLVLSGNPITISGKVKAVPVKPSEGLEIETENGVVTIYGIGPRWFWSQRGVTYPKVGDEIQVEGVEVTLPNGTTRIVATKITVSGKTILLRGEDGRPLWRGGPKGGAKK